jgi:RNA recognition motif-containing protein
MPTSPIYQTPEALPTVSCSSVAVGQYIPVTFDPILHHLPLSENAKQTVIVSQSPGIFSHAFESRTFAFLPYIPAMQPVYETQSHKERITSPAAIYYHRSDPCRYSTQDGTSSYLNPTPDQRASRHLIIRNINPCASYQKLTEHLRAMGVLEQYETSENHKFQRRKGYSKISFRTEEEAKHAASLLDDSVFLGMRIRVAFDSDVPTGNNDPAGRPVPARPLAFKKQQPFVVNGSTSLERKFDKNTSCLLILYSVDRLTLHP